MKNNLNGYTFPETSFAKWFITTVLIVSITCLIGVVIVPFGLVMTGMSVDSISDFIDSEDVRFLLYSNLVGIAFLLPFYLAQRKYKPEPSMKIHGFEYVIYGFFFLLSACFLIDSAWSSLFELLGLLSDEMMEEATSGLSTGSIMLQLISVGIVGPVFEELTFRGYIQDRLASRMNKHVAIVLAAAIFGIYHGNLPQFVSATLGGILYGYLYMMTGSLWVSIIGHCANNSVIIFLENFIPDTNVASIVLDIVLVAMLLFSIFYYYKRGRKVAVA